MIDLVKLKLVAGDGGSGKVSLHREKYRPKGGPDGGAGGDGGSIRLVGDANFNTLKHYAGAKELKAEAGDDGGKNNRHGKQGQDLVLKVPLGTVVWLLAENDVSYKRRKKYEIPDVDFDFGTADDVAADDMAADGAHAGISEGAESAEFKNDGDQTADQIEQTFDNFEDNSKEDNPFRLQIIRSRDEIEFEKYYLEKEGEGIPYRKKKKLTPANPKQESVPVKKFVADEINSELENNQSIQPSQSSFSVLENSDQNSGRRSKNQSKNQSRDQGKNQLKDQRVTIKLVEIKEPNQEAILCQGGFGGRGNSSFKSSTNQTPLEAEYGTPGERKLVVFELRLLADVGLVGFPNAGKSTLLSRLTKAHPKIANYPFTTLEPQLGVMTADQGRKELIIADIPGLIEGASQGKGLGDKFLRHIQNCQELMYILYLEEGVVFNEELSVEEKAKAAWDQYQQLKDELEDHHPDLLDKKYVIGLNKIDIYDDDLIEAIIDLFERKDEEIFPFSSITGDGLTAIKKALF